MNNPRFLRKLELVLVIVFLSGCSINPSTRQSAPAQASQPGESQPSAPGPFDNNGTGLPPSVPVLVSRTVKIPGGGGGTDVVFEAAYIQKIRIELTAPNATIQPYGSLEFPDGKSVYSPPLNTAVNGSNQAEIAINQNGQFTLTVFDGSNQGGTVSLTISVVP